MNEENKKKDSLITMFLLIVASILLLIVLLGMEKTLEWISNNFDVFFSPYQSMGIWFWVIIFSMTAAYIYIMYSGKKIDEDKENHDKM